MANNSIIMKDFTGIQFEAPANAAITPGYLIELMSTGKVRKHAVAEGSAERMFALENDLQGKSIGTDYAEDDVVQIAIFRPGDEVQAWLKDGENVVIGDKLESDGAGQLQKVTAESASVIVGTNILAVAVEAVNLSNSFVAAGRIKVRIV